MGGLEKSISISLIKFSLLFFLNVNVFLSAFAQIDTVVVSKSQVVVFKDSLFIPNGDTVLLIPTETSYSVKVNQYAKSQAFYDSLHSKSYKSEVKKELYNLLVKYRPPEDIFTNEDPVKSESFFKAYKGKTIGSIKVFKVGIFSGSVADTLLIEYNSLERIANKLHPGTNSRVITKNLLFGLGDKIDPYQVADSERIVRALSFIEDARVLMNVNPENLELVDVVVVVKDRFAWSVSADFSSLNKYNLKLKNSSLFGLGNEARIRYLHNKGVSTPDGYDINYTARNIQNSFIDLTTYIANNYKLKGRGFSLSRDFFAPEIKYGGEIRVDFRSQPRNLSFADSTYIENLEITNEVYDIWLGRSFQFSQRRNLSFAARYLKNNLLKRPDVKPDSNEFYHDRDAVLTSITFSKLNFLKTKNILAFNITEDVPVGFTNSLTVGRDWSEFEVRNYVGWKSSFAQFFTPGYFLANLEVGTLLDQDLLENTVFEIGFGYMTPLLSMGRTYNRVFAKWNYFVGNDLSIPISRSLAEDKRMRGISGNGLSGNTVMSGTLESVFFLPWYFLEFRFAPYAFVDFGLAKEDRIEIPYDNFFYGVGGGLRIRNESLVFSTIEISAVYFPTAPEQGSSLGIEISVSTPIIFSTLSLNKPRLVGFEN